MELKDKEAWIAWEENNKDPYGKCCIDVARRVMEILDNGEDFDTHKIICQADKEINAGGITGFMAGCVASMVSTCHVRGKNLEKNGIKIISLEQKEIRRTKE